MLTRLETIVVEKPWGRTDIPAAFGDFGGRRIGEIWFSNPAGDDAPVMVKFLFTSERLSIQVHPDDEAAQAVGFPCGKEECWLILDAEPGAQLGVGLTAETTRETLHDAALDGSIVDMIDWRPSKPLDFVYNRAGTIHAIGGGLTIVEVQQNVDCTYRLYDYGRPRELHLDEGLKVAHPGPVHDPRDTIVDPGTNRMLVSGPYFRLAQLAAPVDAAVLEQATGELTFVPLSAGCRVAGESVALGEAVLLSDPSTIEIDDGARALLTWSA
ncbi:Phosphomannose isomerase-like protein [Sphingopyxis sp. LC81]|uniref:class I mannose-6-phosphate isomerase n=1 Tax=Sphingopyxis sp. LC81 TaxID=1502850 RepID=UPI0005105482|nr:class I mannose-6-phosphate isomerase [Sphingopyxis sp. LC81]KGB54057.1 Phosphomannose isomerase-like protein [Sphingopyxis sp. LC81]